MKGIKLENIYKDYLNWYIKTNVTKRKTNERYMLAITEEKIFITEGHLLVVLPGSIDFPFIRNSFTDMKKIIDKCADKEVHISNMIVDLNGTVCYLLKDDFENDITFINKKMFDRWFVKGEVKLFTENLDNRVPVFIKVDDEPIGLILPVVKR